MCLILSVNGEKDYVYEVFARHFGRFLCNKIKINREFRGDDSYCTDDIRIVRMRKRTAPTRSIDVRGWDEHYHFGLDYRVREDRLDVLDLSVSITDTPYLRSAIGVLESFELSPRLEWLKNFMKEYDGEYGIKVSVGEHVYMGSVVRRTEFIQVSSGNRHRIVVEIGYDGWKDECGVKIDIDAMDDGGWVFLWDVYEKYKELYKTFGVEMVSSILEALIELGYNVDFDASHVFDVFGRDGIEYEDLSTTLLLDGSFIAKSILNMDAVRNELKIRFANGIQDMKIPREQVYYLVPKRV